jgi:hypothetical protein
VKLWQKHAWFWSGTIAITGLNALLNHGHYVFCALTGILYGYGAAHILRPYRAFDFKERA